jgi:DUF1680 family protein
MMIASTVDLVLPNGNNVTVTQETRGPWTGGATFSVQNAGHIALKLAIRKPDGTTNFRVISSRHSITIRT